MPLIELLNVPKEAERIPAYLLNNFRKVQDALSSSASKIGSDDIEITDGSGVILESPDGSRFRVTVDNTGTLVTTAL